MRPPGRAGTYLGLELVEYRPDPESARDREEADRTIAVAAYLDWLRREERERAERVLGEARRRLWGIEVKGEPAKGEDR